MKHLFTLLLLLSTLNLFSQQNIEITKTELSKDVQQIQINKSTSLIAVYGGDQVILIDAGYGQTAQLIKDSLSTQNIKYIINTHFHSDHVGGNLAFKPENIIAHKNVATRVSSKQIVKGNQSQPIDEAARPNIIVEKDMDIEFYNHKIKLIHLPNGHTDGDLIVYLPKAKVLAVGDLLFADYFPFVDRDNGGTLNGYLKNIEWIVTNIPSDVKVVGGHGPVYKINQYKEYLKTLKETIEIIKTLKSSNKSQEEIIAEHPFKKWESFGKFFITEEYWIETVYKSL